MVDDTLADLAKHQHGVFSRSQVLAVGGDDELIRRRLSMAWWVQKAPGVYGLRSWADSWLRYLWIAHLDLGPGSVVSHEAAAALHSFPTFDRVPVVLTVPHGHHQRLGAFQVHQAKDLRPSDVTHAGQLPVTTKARTLFDLAAVTSVQRYERVVDEAHASGSCRIEELRTVYHALRRPGKRGVKRLREVLEARSPGFAPPASELERRLVTALRKGGLPEPKRQYPLPWRHDTEDRVDLAYPRHRVLIEADGRRWHSRMDQMAADRRRDREALNHGWRPYRFMWEEVTGHPDVVCATVRLALHQTVRST